METTNNILGPSIYRNIQFSLYFVVVHAILFCNFFFLTNTWVYINKTMKMNLYYSC